MCDDSILQSVASSLFWIGWLVGNIVIGYMSDKLGRKKANQLSAALVFFSSWILIWPKQLWMFILCRFVTGIGSGKLTMDYIYNANYQHATGKVLGKDSFLLKLDVHILFWGEGEV